jgi:hypothetical protein
LLNKTNILIYYLEIHHLFYRLYWKFFGYEHPKLSYKIMLPKNQLNTEIFNRILLGEPIYYIRFGETEFRSVWQNLKLKNGVIKKYREDMLNDLEKLAGVYPINKDFVSRFANHYLGCSSNATNIGVWLGVRERFIIKNFIPNAIVNYSTDIEPFFIDIPWTKALENKKVLVVHSFIHSIKHQKQFLNLIHPNNMMPDFELIVVKPPLTTVFSERSEKDWFDELSKFILSISKLDFDVALVSSGSYGIPICNEIFKLGKSALYLGGVLQLFFGIKGARWTRLKQYEILMNEHWIYPLQIDVNEDFKKQFLSLENSGGYW